MKFGDRLKELRKSKELTQAELAKLFSLGESTISFYESNKRTPDYELLKQIADYFNVSIDYLLGRSNVRNPEENKVITKAFHSIDIEGLPDEAIKQVEEYVEFIKSKYKSNETSKK